MAIKEQQVQPDDVFLLRNYDERVKSSSFGLSVIAHFFIILIFVFLAGVTTRVVPHENLISVEIMRGGGGGGGGGNNMPGANASENQITENKTNIDTPGKIEEIDKQPAVSDDRARPQDTIINSQKQKTENPVKAKATSTQESSNNNGTTQKTGTHGSGGGEGNGTGTGRGEGTGTGDGGGNGSGHGTGNGSGTGPGEGSGSGGGKGNFPIGAFNNPISCGKSSQGDINGRSASLSFRLTYKNGKVSLSPSNSDILRAFYRIKGTLDANKEYSAVIVCDCGEGGQCTLKE